jgi:hypothetical protein
MSILFSKNFSTGSFVRPQGYNFPVGLTIAGAASGNVAVEYLVVAGGGGGGGGISGGNHGGGGGAGGYLTGSTTLSTPASVTIGAGGVGVGNITFGNPGSNSVLGPVTATGGGGGGYTLGNDGTDGLAGGSGGGAGWDQNFDQVGGLGTPGQGNNGGIGIGGGGGIGGGAGASGASGGSGTASPISGSPVTYAIGGTASGATGNRPANTGHGGHGWQIGYAGGSGIVIVRYLGEQTATGGTITSSGGYIIHTFTGDGSFAQASFNIN